MYSNVSPNGQACPPPHNILTQVSRIMTGVLSSDALRTDADRRSTMRMVKTIGFCVSFRNALEELFTDVFGCPPGPEPIV